MTLSGKPVNYSTIEALLDLNADIQVISPSLVQLNDNLPHSHRHQHQYYNTSD